MDHVSIDIIWPCNCLICKYFTKPLLRILLKNELKMLDEYLEKRRYREVIHMAEEVREEVSVDLKREMEELKKAVDGLKNVIAELRASLTDLTSPYALLKSMPPTVTSAMETKEEIAGVKEAEKPVEEFREKPTMKKKKPGIMKIKTPIPGPSRPQPSVKPPEGPPPMGETPVQYKPTPYEESKKSITLEELREMIKELGKAIGEEERRITRPKLDIRRVIYILKTIYNLRRALPKESIENTIKLAEILGLITSTDREILNTIGSLVEDALRQDLTPDEQILVLYVLLKNLGYIDETLEEEIIRIVSDVVTSRKKIVAALKNTSARKESLAESELSKNEGESREVNESEKRG